MNILQAFSTTSTILFTIIFVSSLWRLVESKNDKPEYLGKPILLDDDDDPSFSSAKIKRQQTGEIENDVGSGSGSESDQVPKSPPSSPDEQNLTSEPSPPPSPSTFQTQSPTTPSTVDTTTSTTEMPFIIPGEGKTNKGYFCFCDFQVKECDINCCCDLDCSDEEKSTFSGGCTESIIYDPKHRQNLDHSCVKSYIMYRNNAPYRVDRTSKGLLCVVKDNLKKETEFSQKDMARIKNSISHGRIDSKPKYKWDNNLSGAPFKIEHNSYKYGNAIWLVKLGEGEDSGILQEDLLRLPASYLTETCSINEPVKYLQDFTESCALSIAQLSSQCQSTKELNANHFIKNYMIIANPNVTDFNTTDDYEQVEVKPSKLCQSDWKTCKSLSVDEASEDDASTEFLHPSLSDDKMKCKNTLTHLNLTFIHNGIEGIIGVKADAVLVDIPVDAKMIQQHFTVKFVWTNAHKSKSQIDLSKNDTNDTEPSNEDIFALQKLPRSGNPGYITGRPIILGRKVISTAPPANDSGSGTTAAIERIHVLPDTSQWLHIQGAGDCPLDSFQLGKFDRHPVLYGYEQISSCKLSLDSFNYCQELQRHITSIFLGDEDLEKFINTPPFVAAYGSPDAFPSDWVPITFTQKSNLLSGLSFPSAFLGASSQTNRGCGAITTSIHITIAYAYVGPVDSPQAKVTGVFFEPDDPIQLPPVTEEAKDKTAQHQVIVTTTVSFLDVTEKPTTHVASWPVLSIQLPSDFFYPFSSSPSTNTASSSGDSGGKPEVSSMLGILALVLGVFVIA